MEKRRFGLLLRVADLQLCRTFYRDLLRLGEPAADSSFATEFEVSENFVLRLELNTSPALEHASSAASWIFECSDPQSLLNSLADAGYPVEPVPETRGGGTCFRASDPEGNVFLVAAAD